MYYFLLKMNVPVSLKNIIYYYPYNIISVFTNFLIILLLLGKTRQPTESKSIIILTFN